MLARLDTTEMCQRNDQANGSMTAHSEITDVVEENDACDATSIVRLAKEGPHHYIRSARFVDHGRTKAIVLLAENAHTARNRPRAEIRSAINNDASRLAGRMRI